MRHFTQPILLGAVACLAAGCTSTQITNLTASRQPRNPNHLYSFEADWHSNQQSIRKDSIRGFVVIGTTAHPMQPVPLVPHRWETLVPIPAEQSAVNYHFKFDFDYNSVPVVRSDSKRTKSFQLQVE